MREEKKSRTPAEHRMSLRDEVFNLGVSPAAATSEKRAAEDTAPLGEQCLKHAALLEGWLQHVSILYSIPHLTSHYCG